MHKRVKKLHRWSRIEAFVKRHIEHKELSLILVVTIITMLSTVLASVSTVIVTDWLSRQSELRKDKKTEVEACKLEIGLLSQLYIELCQDTIKLARIRKQLFVAILDEDSVLSQSAYGKIRATFNLERPKSRSWELAMNSRGILERRTGLLDSLGTFFFRLENISNAMRDHLTQWGQSSQLVGNHADKAVEVSADVARVLEAERAKIGIEINGVLDEAKSLPLSLSHAILEVKLSIEGEGVKSLQ
jgi:hypothetical protein